LVKQESPAFRRESVNKKREDMSLRRHLINRAQVSPENIHTEAFAALRKIADQPDNIIAAALREADATVTEIKQAAQENRLNVLIRNEGGPTQWPS
jgi:hypothetical protein